MTNSKPAAISPYKISRTHGAVMIHWVTEARPNTANAIRIVATETEAQLWINAR